MAAVAFSPDSFAPSRDVAGAWRGMKKTVVVFAGVPFGAVLGRREVEVDAGTATMGGRRRGVVWAAPPTTAARKPRPARIPLLAAAPTASGKKKAVVAAARTTRRSVTRAGTREGDEGWGKGGGSTSESPPPAFSLPRKRRAGERKARRSARLGPALGRWPCRPSSQHPSVQWERCATRRVERRRDAAAAKEGGSSEVCSSSSSRAGREEAAGVRSIVRRDMDALTLCSWAAERRAAAGVRAIAKASDRKI
jgi:hypothetical protein